MQLQNGNFKKMAKVLAVTGGKGGIGKTSIAINLAVTLAGMSQNVMLLDADMGLANVDVMLGIKTKNTVCDVLAGKCRLEDVVVQGPNGISIIPASSGNMKMASLGYVEISGLINAFSQMNTVPNYLLIDTAAGITECVMGFAAAADEIIVVVCNEPTSVADAYALIKLLNKHFCVHKFRIVINKVRETGESEEVFAKLIKVTDKFLNVSVTLVGSVPEDKFMKQSIRKAKSIVTEYPYSLGTGAFHEIARNIMNLPTSHRVTGHMQFFQPQLVEG